MAAGLFPVGNADAFGHLAAGRQIAQQGSIPRFDGFSLWKPTPQPWNNYEWLSDLLFWEAFSLFGSNGLIAFKLLLLAVLAGLLVWRGWRANGNLAAWLTGLLIVAAIPGVRFRLAERPHLFGIVLAALFLAGLPRIVEQTDETASRVRAKIWICGLVVAQIGWVNLHGSNLFGLALTGIYLFAHLRRPAAVRYLAALLGLQLLASCLSPFGPTILFDSLRHIADPEYRKVVTEWASWSTNDPVWMLAAPLIQTSLAILAAPSLVRRGPAGWASLCVVFILAFMSFRSLRFIGEYLLLSAPVLAEGLAESLGKWPRKRLIAVSLPIAAAICVAAPVGAAYMPPFLPLGWGFTARNLPAGSAAWLAQYLPNPRLFAAIEDSWYLVYELPEARVLVDGRTPFYGARFVREATDALESPPLLRKLLEQYRIDVVVVRHVYQAHQAALRTMLELTDWRLVIIENRYATFIRLSPYRGAMLSREALANLPVGYQTGAVWAPDADVAAQHRELKMLARYPNTEAYRGWISALAALKPMLRADGLAGLRPSRDADEQEAATAVAAQLLRTARAVDDIPIIHAYRAMAAVAACDLKTAREALEEARAQDDSRETLLIAQEIALRENRTAEVRDFLDKAYALGNTRSDPWLAALSAALANPPRCP